MIVELWAQFVFFFLLMAAGRFVFSRLLAWHLRAERRELEKDIDVY
ncbi:MAG: hypothetical protein PHV02_03380 [Rhodocyclaceae bacterium]|nr:hypothetical protein [Rhodocyclaceae bacterium]